MITVRGDYDKIEALTFRTDIVGGSKRSSINSLLGFL